MLECKLSDIADVVDCEHKTAPTVSKSDYYSIRTTDILGGKIDFQNANRVSYETYLEWTKRALPESGDLILAREAPVGEIGWIKKGYKVCLGQRTVLIKLKNNQIDSRYLLYYFVNPSTKSQLQEQSGGSVVSHLNMKDIRNFDLQIPSIEEQKAIASVLSSLDDKIDLLHRQNTTLERMAETLFRQWFIEEAQEVWEETTIAELVEFNPPRKLSKGQTAPYLDMAGLDTSTFSPSGWYLREFSSGTKFINNDTLLARITPCLENGKTGYVTFLNDSEVGWGSTEFTVMRPKLGIHPFFAYVLARYQDFRDYAEGCMEGSSGRQRVNVDHLKEYQIRIPSNEVIKRFNEAVSAITPKLDLNAKQIKTLEKLRDNLLPKLMSGELRIADE